MKPVPGRSARSISRDCAVGGLYCCAFLKHVYFLFASLSKGLPHLQKHDRLSYLDILCLFRLRVDVICEAIR